VATFALYELAVNHDIQVRLRKEIEEVIAKHNGEVTYDSLHEMKYLDMVFNETLRKYPVVDVHFRQCTRSFKIPNSKLTIPKDAAIMLSAHSLHHDERFWEEPEKFDPDRFLDENIKKRHPFCYIPFSKSPDFMNLLEHFIIFPTR
jgi:cytochrome P450 family 6